MPCGILTCVTPAPNRLGHVLTMLCLVIGVTFTGWVMQAHGYGVGLQFRLLAVQVVTVLLPGIPLSTWAARAPWPGRIAAAWVCGVPLQLAGWLAGVLLDSTLAMWLVPPALGLVAAVLFRRHLTAEWHVRHYRMPWWSAPVILIAWFHALWRFAEMWFLEPGGENATALYGDLYWHQAINGAALHRVPLTDPQALTEWLSYHWLTNAHVAAISRTGDIDLTWLATQGWTVPAYLATIGLAIGFATHLTRGGMAGPLAAVLVSFPPIFALDRAMDSGTTSNFILLSPSHMFALPLTIGLAWGVVTLLRRSRSSSGAAVPAVVLLLAISPAAKISSLPVLLCGLLAAFVVALLFRRRHALPLGLLLAATGLVLVASFPLFGGGGGGSEFQLLGTVEQRPIWKASLEVIQPMGPRRELLLLVSMGVVLILNQLFAVIGVAAWRWKDPVGWFLAGMIGSALGVAYVLVHPGASQLYFPLGIQPLIAITTAVGLTVLVRRARRTTGPVILGTSVLVAAVAGLAAGLQVMAERRVEMLGLGVVALHLGVTAGFLVITAIGIAIRRHLAAVVAASMVLAFSLGSSVHGFSQLPVDYLDEQWVRDAVTVKPDERYVIQPGEWEAARWARDHLPVDAVVATNLHCRGVVSFDHCEARGFWVSALSERQVLLGGWAYTTLGRSTEGEGGYNHVLNPYPDEELYALNEKAFTSPDANTIDDLRDMGVTHLFAVERASEVSDDLDEFCTELFVNDEAMVCSLER